MKSILFLLALILAVQVKTQTAYAITSGDYTYSLNGNKATITKYIGSGGEITIPSKIDGHDVVAIGDYAFLGNDKITKVIISNGIATVGDAAFQGCYYLKSVIFPNSVSDIGEDTFYFSSNLESVTLPNRLTSIKTGAFFNTAIKNIIIPSTVTNIGEYSFGSCGSLSSVNIPSSVKKIDDLAFKGSGLTKITIPSGVTSIGEFAFAECSKLTRIDVDINNKVYSSLDGVFYNKAKTTLFSFPANNPATVFNIPSSVKIIYSDAFVYNKNLNKVTITSSVTSIGEEAFLGCESLKSINIPSSVAKINDSTFSYCGNLKEINLSSSLTDIGNYAFIACINLQKINIPNSIKNIGDYAFFNCKSLTEANFYGNAPKIGSCVFDGCPSSFKVYYLSGKTGYTNPWKGYKTQIFYNVTYNGNGNTNGAVPIDMNKHFNKSLAVVLGNTGNLVKTGYTFGGWNTKADGTGTTYAPNAKITFGTSNVTLYAKWVPNKYSVTYSGNGNTSGKVPADLNKYLYKSSITVLGNSGNLARIGYTFGGWNTSADGKGTTYAQGAKFTIGAANIILYAKWIPNKYSVTYVGNGSTSGKVPAGVTQYVYKSTVTVLGNTGKLIRNGYTFAGWNTRADGKGTTYAPGAKITMGPSNVVLYAKWVKK